MNNRNPVDLMNGANRAHAESRFHDCEKMCRAILEIEPRNVSALVLAGVAALKRDEAETSIPYFQKAILSDPGCAPAYQWLSMSHRKLGQKSEALMRAKEAVARNPSDALAQNQLGLCYLDVNDFKSAEASFLKTVSLAPNVAAVYFGLGIAYQGLNRNPDAISAFRRSARLDPSSIPTQISLRQTLMDEGDAVGAAQVSREVLKLQPGSAEANLWLALALMEVNKATEAEGYMRRGIELEPDSAVAHTLLGLAFKSKGDLEDADAHFRRSIEILPEQGSAYQGFATNRRVTESDRPMVEQMKELSRSGDMSIVELSQLHYALGKSLEDLREYEDAMHHLDEANRLTYQIKYGNRTYDPKALDSYDQRARTFTAELLERHRGAGSSSDTPIIVVGMIRSGTTLAEQILSCHQIVGAAGEQRFWLENGNAPISGAGLDLPMLSRLAARYEKTLQEIAPGKARIVDKMPMNYQSIGLIHLAFPKAKIIHMVRHPIDTCISIYATPNRSRIEWANDKGNIVLAYHKYLELMDHWRKVLPFGTMLEVRYEEIVSDPEPNIRALVDFCGLEWNEACLHPELNQRSVVTPSVTQVRQPLYKTSIERWKKFEPWLGPFAKLKGL